MQALILGVMKGISDGAMFGVNASLILGKQISASRNDWVSAAVIEFDARRTLQDMTPSGSWVAASAGEANDGRSVPPSALRDPPAP